jgi:hypothetical protein
VKNLAKLILSFTFSFIIVLILAVLAGLLSSWADAALLFPPAAISVSPAVLSLPLYFSLLFGISYSFRQGIPYLASLIVLLALSLGLTMAASTGISRLEKINPPGMTVPPVPVQPGLMLTITPGDTPTRAVLLGSEGVRVLSLPGQALVFEPASASYRSRRVRLPFPEERNAVLSGISADFAGSSGVLEARFDAGLVPFAMYAGSLSLFLISIGCLVNISFWPLANLFFGALAFRGALALESFLNTPETHQLLSSFAGNIIPESLINPVIFTVLGTLILLYSGLVYLARGRRAE